jgi:transposase-like protein
MVEQRKPPRKRRKFTEEFKAEAVQLCRVGDRSIGQVAKDLDLTENALREWVKKADIEVGKGPPGALTQAEREELVQLRKENRRLLIERDILKKAAAFFAKEHP